MKLIIELDDDIAKGIRGENDCEVEPREVVRSFQATIADAIVNAIPYDPSGDLISREALIREIGRTDEWYKGRSVCDIIDSAMSMNYTFLPQYQVDLQCAYDCGYEKGKNDRPKGEWIFKHNSSDIWCSVCDENFDEIPQAFNFCPNCGADMRKGGKNETQV